MRRQCKNEGKGRERLERRGHWTGWCSRVGEWDALGIQGGGDNSNSLHVMVANMESTELMLVAKWIRVVKLGS